MQLVCYNLLHNTEMFQAHAICEESPCAEGNQGSGVFGKGRETFGEQWKGRRATFESLGRTSKSTKASACVKVFPLSAFSRSLPVVEGNVLTLR